MKELNHKELLNYITDVIKDAAEMIPVTREGMVIEEKTNRNDLVTTVDKVVETYVVKKLEEKLPYPVLGEEGHNTTSFDGYTWLIDPIDGTMNFVETKKKLRYFIGAVFQ